MIPYIFLKIRYSKFRVVYSIIFVVSIIWPFFAKSQQIGSGQKQLLNLPNKEIRLDSLGNLIADESGFVFSFNATNINPGKKIIIPGTIKRLNSLLSYLNESYGLGHKMIGNHVILYKDKTVDREEGLSLRKQELRIPQKKRPIANKGKITDSLPEESKLNNLIILPWPGSSVAFKVPSFVLPKVVGEHFCKVNPLQAIRLAKSTAPSKNESDPLFSKDNNDKNAREIGNIRLAGGKSRLYVSAGVTADEVLYANPKVRIGLPWLFATATWGTNFKSSVFLYGIGTSIGLSDNWNLRLSVSHGTLVKDFKQFPSSDSLIRIKARLTRISLLAEKRISNRLSFQFGPVFNLVKNHYSLNDLSLSNSSLPLHTDLSNTYHILHPLYTISKSYNKNTSSGKKSWIGLQLGLFYRLW